MYRFLLSFFFSFLLLAGSVSGQSALAEVDALRESGRYAEALSRLQQLVQADGENADLHWRKARINVDLGEAASTEAEQRRYFLDAEEHARTAIDLDPQSGEAYLALAIAVGRVGLISDTRRKIELSRQVKEYAEQAVALDPGLDLAYHVLARWHHEVASLPFTSRAVARLVYGGLPRASFEDAAANFKKAIAAREAVVHHVYLGRTYIAMKNHSEAVASLERALTVPARDAKDASFRQEARDLLAQLGR